MPSYRVANLKWGAGGVEKGVGIDPKKEESEYGEFAWIKDGAVNRIEFGELPKVR